MQWTLLGFVVTLTVLCVMECAGKTEKGMGCRTGFYLLTVNMEYFAVLRLLRECFQKALEFTAIPGSEKKECGNYLEHDLDEALKEIKEYLTVLEGLS